MSIKLKTKTCQQIFLFVYNYFQREVISSKSVEAERGGIESKHSCKGGQLSGAGVGKAYRVLGDITDTCSKLESQ